MAKPATFFANFPVNKHPSTSEVIRRYRSTYEGCDLVPLVTSSIGDSELIIHFQKAYARLFPNCYNKQGIRSNLPSYTPMNQGNIYAKVYPEGIQPIKENNQLLQLCTAPTAWSDSVIRSETSLITESSDSVMKLVSVLFGKCTTLVITKC